MNDLITSYTQTLGSPHLSAAQQGRLYSQLTQIVVLSYHKPVAHQLETVRLPLQVHERGTVYSQPSAQTPNRSFPSKKNLNPFFFGLSFCL